MEFCLVPLTILQPRETLATMFANMLCLFWKLWTMDNPYMSVKVSLDTPKPRTDCARKLHGRNPRPLLQLFPVNPFLMLLQIDPFLKLSSTKLTIDCKLSLVQYPLVVDGS